jgi:hypothetical protein
MIRQVPCCILPVVAILVVIVVVVVLLDVPLPLPVLVLFSRSSFLASTSFSTTVLETIPEEMILSLFHNLHTFSDAFRAKACGAFASFYSEESQTKGSF